LDRPAILSTKYNTLPSKTPHLIARSICYTVYA
jgi:hypothetical protein